MRVCLITIFFLIFGLNFVKAQRFGYIDTDFILNKMPEYKKAQDEINQLSQAWEKEVQDMSRKIDGMYAALQAEEVLLTEEMKKERMDAIQKKEAELGIEHPVVQLTGRTMCDRIVVFEGNRRQIGETIDIGIYDANAHTLFGTVVTQHLGAELVTLG